MAIILASTSPIRRRLLENAGVPFIAKKPTVDEQELKRNARGLARETLPLHLASAKALSISKLLRDDLVIGADQVLSFSGKAFDKPASSEEAKLHLAELRGKSHTLISAVCCARGDEILWHYSNRAELTMRYFSDRFLEDYIATAGADISTSVGAYKLEGQGIQLFERVDGDYFTVLGLPLLPLLEFLRSTGEIGS